MERTSAPIPHAGGTYAPRELPHLLGGILTLRSDWTPPFGEALLRAIRDSGDDVQRLDMGCAANAGAFSVLAGNPITLKVWDSSAGTLVWFVTRLLAELQALATVPAIDITRWADIALAEGLDKPARAEA